MACLNDLDLEELGEMNITELNVLMLDNCLGDGDGLSPLSVRVCHLDYLSPTCKGTASKIFNVSPRVNP